MFCINCGKELPDTSKFCAVCGTAVNSGQNNRTNIQPTPPAAPVVPVAVVPVYVPVSAPPSGTPAGFIERFGCRGSKILIVWIEYLVLQIVNCVGTVVLYTKTNLLAGLITGQLTAGSLAFLIVFLLVWSGIMIAALIMAIVITVRTAKTYVTVCVDRVLGNCTRSDFGSDRYFEIPFNQIKKVYLKGNSVYISTFDRNKVVIEISETEKAAFVLRNAMHNYMG